MKQLAKTKVTLRLRKAEDRKEWYVYIESYPVEVCGKKTPQRIREYLNRSITTVECAKRTLAGIEVIHMLRKNQMLKPITSMFKSFCKLAA
jgi:hypothetical protein